MLHQNLRQTQKILFKFFSNLMCDMYNCIFGHNCLSGYRPPVLTDSCTFKPLKYKKEGSEQREKGPQDLFKSDSFIVAEIVHSHGT